MILCIQVTLFIDGLERLVFEQLQTRASETVQPRGVPKLSLLGVRGFHNSHQVAPESFPDSSRLSNAASVSSSDAIQPGLNPKS